MSKKEEMSDIGSSQKVVSRTRASSPAIKKTDASIEKATDKTSTAVKDLVKEPVASSSGLKCISSFLVVVANVVCLISLCFSYSYSGFKPNLKEHFQWDEMQLGTVFALQAFGQNFVVHIGLFNDRFGSPAAFLLAGLLKGVGLFGMWWCVTTRMSNPWVFGAFFFLDTQGMSGGLIMAMKEVLRAVPDRFSGIFASVNTAAFGMGAVYMTSLYDYFFSPDVAKHILSAGVQGVATLAICAVLIPLLLPKPKVKTFGHSTQESIRPVILSDAYFAIFVGMLVIWGGGMVWNANISSFSQAADFPLASQAVIRSYFYTAKTGFALVFGPLVDCIGFVEVWYVLVAVLMFGSAAVMYVSNGGLMFVAAVMAGGAFGAVATLIPIMCKKLSPKNIGTLYALAKFAGLISGTCWNYYAGYISQSLTKAGETSCKGDECYRNSWMLILICQAPMVAYLAFWVARTISKSSLKKKAD